MVHVACTHMWWPERVAGMEDSLYRWRQAQSTSYTTEAARRKLTTEVCGVLSLSSSRMLVWHPPAWSPAAQDTGCLRRLLLDQKADSPSAILQVAFLGKKIWPWKTLPQPSLQTAPPGTLWMMGKAEAEGCRGHNPPLLLIYECPGLRSNIQNSTVQANPLWSKSS